MGQKNADAHKRPFFLRLVRPVKTPAFVPPCRRQGIKTYGSGVFPLPVGMIANFDFLCVERHEAGPGSVRHDSRYRSYSGERWNDSSLGRRANLAGPTFAVS